MLSCKYETIDTIRYENPKEYRLTYNKKVFDLSSVKLKEIDLSRALNVRDIVSIELTHVGAYVIK